MKYNRKNKLEQISQLENNQEAQAMTTNTQDNDFKSSFTNSAPTKTQPQIEQKIEQKQSGKKRIFTFSINEELMGEIDEFLNEFGERGESKSSFTEEALRAYLSIKKANIKDRLLDKIKKLNS
ncbi:hypothetical protein LS74_000390 [Helicobacter magdeburgensis]|uniref:Uncharacterized protein n=1 Tax=Helicobacter magdeburgensis TaxID=471858 RepID=A0A4U8T3B1_9HELI|nr:MULTISPECIES: ribbon-helix-helix domain-containing protein [Helicobacter]TLD93844.1 hypothetical protein LS74_000390 [Helicobacter magdeburgensis]BDB64127.1 hypothetical protein T36_0574 [Helicobacter cinaedi]BDB65303.1 hypothetical protein T36_1779 [Helicobacter cinaedi]BDB65554.1 hypothetical protein T36_2033 [Helicobacter cinaedi]